MLDILKIAKCFEKISASPRFWDDEPPPTIPAPPSEHEYEEPSVKEPDPAFQEEGEPPTLREPYQESPIFREDIPNEYKEFPPKPTIVKTPPPLPKKPDLSKLDEFDEVEYTEEPVNITIDNSKLEYLIKYINRNITRDRNTLKSHSLQGTMPEVRINSRNKHLDNLERILNEILNSEG